VPVNKEFCEVPLHAFCFAFFEQVDEDGVHRNISLRHEPEVGAVFFTHGSLHAGSISRLLTAILITWEYKDLEVLAVVLFAQLCKLGVVSLTVVSLTGHVNNHGSL